MHVMYSFARDHQPTDRTFGGMERHPLLALLSGVLVALTFILVAMLLG